MIDRTHALPLTRQNAVVGDSRGAIYFEPRPGSDLDLAPMRRIDALHSDSPVGGPRRGRVHLEHPTAQDLGWRTPAEELQQLLQRASSNGVATTD